MTVSSSAPVRLRRLVGWGVIGQGVYVASQFVLLVSMARFATLEEIGYFGLASAVIIPIYWFFRLDLRVSLATDTAHRFRLAEYAGLLLVSMALAYAILVGLTLTLLPAAASAIVLIFGAAKAMETFSELCYGMFQRERRMHHVAQSQILRGSASAVLFAIVLATTGDVEAGILVLAIVWGVFLAIFDIPLALRCARRDGDHVRIQPRRLAALAWMTFPLGLHGLLSALQGNMPRYVIERLIGIAALGQFTAVAYSMQAMTTVALAIAHSTSGVLARQADTGNRTAFFRVLAKLSGAMLAAGLFATALCGVFGDWIMVSIFGPNFANLGGLLAICMFSASLRSLVVLFQGALIATRHFTWTLLIRIGTTILMLVMCLAGAAVGELEGIAVGMCLTFAINVAVLWIALALVEFPERDEAARPPHADSASRD